MVSFFYGPDRKRYKRVDETLADGTSTTIYVADRAYERISRPGETEEKVYIGDFAVVTRVTASGGSDSMTTDYLHRDHLGSVDVITDAGGNLIQQMSFDAFGKRREVNWTPLTGPAILAFDTRITRRGFTGHEQIDPVGLVHMNGRVYDPEIGRFLSADPVVENIDNLQTYNRYSYVRNNPLTLTDPSGFYASPTADLEDSTNVGGDNSSGDTSSDEGASNTDPAAGSEAEIDEQSMGQEGASAVRGASASAAEAAREQPQHGLETPDGAMEATQRADEIGQNPSQEEFKTAHDISEDEKAVARAIQRALNNAYENTKNLISSMTGEDDEAENKPENENEPQNKVEPATEEPVEELEENVLRPPAGSKPIDQTPWSGNHTEIKKNINARPGNKVSISPGGDVWGENVDGTWTNHGPAEDFTGAGEPRGKRGKDRGGRGRRGR